MTIFLYLYIMLGIAAWEVLGCIVCAFLDTDGRLLEWAKQCPLGFWFVPFIWPIVLGMWAYDKRRAY